MKARTILLGSLILGLFFIAGCQQASSPDVSVTEQSLQDEIIGSTDLFRTFDGGEVQEILWKCYGECSIGCYLYYDPATGITCSCPNSCVSALFNGTESYFPGDPEYETTMLRLDGWGEDVGLFIEEDDLWDTESVRFSQMVEFYNPSTDVSALRAHYELDTGETGTILFTNADGESIVWNCEGDCDCLEAMNDAGEVICSCNDCSANQL